VDKTAVPERGAEGKSARRGKGRFLSVHGEERSSPDPEGGEQRGGFGGDCKGDAKEDEDFRKSVSLDRTFFTEVLAAPPLLRHHGA
jgi:hypothetical protein